MNQRWRIKGEYFESCNCEVLCPCLLSRAQAPPTEGHCDVVLAVHVAEGAFGSVALAGLNGALAIYTPGVMAAGGWTVAPYVDARADLPQRAALEAILTGRAGGPLGRFAPLIATCAPARAIEIRLAIEGRLRRLSMPGVADVTVEGIPGAGEGEVWLDNVGHFASRRLAAARGATSRFHDQGLAFDNSGRNGHYARIEWSNT